MAGLHQRTILCLLTTNHAAKYLTLASRNYSRQNKKQTDPRRNVQYPYVKGDPIQEDIIKSSKTSLSSLKDKDSKTDSRRKENWTKQINVFQTASGLKYEKLKEGDSRLGQTIMESKSHQGKKATGNIFLEGQRLILDALQLGVQAKSLYFCDPEVLNVFPPHLIQGVGLYKIMYKDMKIWSNTTTPSGIMGVFQKPQEGKTVSTPATILPITLVFDRLKDPGNVGTLIRTAAAVGCQRVIAIKGTVNVWDCKILRSAMAGHFSVPIYTGLSWADVPNYLDDGTQVFLANTIQASILAGAFNARLRSEELDKALDDGDVSDSNSDSDEDPQLEDNRSLLAERNSATFHDVPLPICEYSDIILNLPHSNHSVGKGSHTASVALILGGETEGLSAQAKRFAYTHYGQYVTIPMSETVNSLNTGIAGSIILYELRKKLLAVRSGT